MNEERIIALWTETVEECTPFLDRVKRFYEHKITVLIMYDKVELREYTMLRGTKEWLLENKILKVPRERLMDMLNEELLP
jgi:hypothetical protein